MAEDADGCSGARMEKSSDWRACFSQCETWASQVLVEASPSQQVRVPALLQPRGARRALPAAILLPTQRKGELFRSTFFANRTNLRCFLPESLSSAGDVKRVDDLGFQGLNAQLPYLDVPLNYCTARCGRSYLWFNLRMRTSLS